MVRNLARLLVLALLVGTAGGRLAAQQQSPKELAQKHIEAGNAARNKQDFKTAIAEFRKAVELDLDNVAAHESFISATEAANTRKALSPTEDFTERRRIMRESHDATKKQLAGLYRRWAKQYPDNAAMQWALARINRDQYNIARPYYLRAVELDPKLARAYASLGTIAEHSGQDEQAREFFRRAAEASPDDPHAHWRYIGKFRQHHPEKFRKLVDEFVARFPKSELAARVQVELAEMAQTPAEKIAILEKMKANYPETKYPGYGTRDLFDAYLQTDAAKALQFAETNLKGADKEWQKKHIQGMVSVAQALVEARSLMAEKNYAQALEVLEKSPEPKRKEVLLARAEAAELMGNTAQAYQLLATRMAESPSDGMLKALEPYAAKLAKNSEQVQADIWKIRYQQCKQIEDFQLARYDGGKVKLSQARGNVVLLNFWFPG